MSKWLLAGQAEHSGRDGAALALGRWADLSCRWNNQGCMKMDGFWQNAGMGAVPWLHVNMKQPKGCVWVLEQPDCNSPPPSAGVLKRSQPEERTPDWRGTLPGIQGPWSQIQNSHQSPEPHLIPRGNNVPPQKLRIVTLVIVK